MLSINKINENSKLLCKKALCFFRDGKNPSFTERAILFLITVVIFFSFIYADIYAFSTWSVTAWDALFDGRIFEYYKYCIDNVYGINNVYNGGDIFTVFILVIWNFPLYIAKQFLGVNIIYSIPALLWSKAIYLVAQIINMKLVYKIALKLKLSRVNAKWAVFAFCASSALLFGAYLNCQTDITYIPFYLAGFLFLLDGKRKRFILLFAISIAIKPFPLIFFFPMILVVEKKPQKCILYVLGGLSICLIVKFISGYIPFYTESVKDINELYIKNFFINNFYTGAGGIALFPVVYIILCVFVYTSKQENEDDKNRLLLFAAFAALATYFAFTRFEHYRIIIIAPFGALLVVQSVKHNRLLGVCYAVFMLTFLLAGAYTNSTVFEIFHESTLERMFLSKVFGSTKFLSRKYLSSNEVLIEYIDIFMNGITGISLAMLILIAYFSHPKQYLDDARFVVAKEIMWAQILPIIIAIIIICESYFTLK